MLDFLLVVSLFYRALIHVQEGHNTPFGGGKLLLKGGFESIRSARRCREGISLIVGYTSLGGHSWRKADAKETPSCD